MAALMNEIKTCSKNTETREERVLGVAREYYMMATWPLNVKM
jgi:hypothetical protein